MMKKEHKFVAPLFIFLSGFVWSFTGLFSKLVPWGPFTLVGFRSVVATVMLALIRGTFRVRPNKAMWLGAAGSLLTSLLYMIAIRFTAPANAIVFQYTAPVFVILYTFFVKKQKPLRSELVSAVFVMLGVCLCFASGLGSGRLAGDLVALLSGVSYAMVFLVARYSDNDPLDNVYLGMLLSCLFMAFVPFDANFSLTPSHLLVGVCMGLGLGGGYLFFSLGMRRKISPVAAVIISNVEPVLNPVWVFLITRENPGMLTILGAAVVLLSATLQPIYEAWKERRMGRTLPS